MITTFEILATVFGLTQGALIMLNKRCNWIFYVLQMMAMIAFSWMNHLYGDVANSSVYLVVGVVGFIMWGTDKGSKVEYAKCLERAVWFSVIVVGTVVGSAVLGKTDDPLPTLDAFTTVSSFVATILMVRHKIDTWVVWFFNDIFYCVEYWLLPNQALYLLALNVIWTVMAVCSFIMWRREYSRQCGVSKAV